MSGDLLKDRLHRACALTFDLFDHLEGDDLAKEIPGLPSNPLSGQLWCIVGARESYGMAIAAGTWQGFACSLLEPGEKPAALEALRSSMNLIASLELTDDVRLALAFDLLEHEIQHHGQLIRYVYANRLTFPPSWNKRYTV